MGIKKTRFNFNNGKEFDVYHPETQAGQVKVSDINGELTFDLDETLLTGRLIEGMDYNSITSTGIYRVKGGTNHPEGIDEEKIYILDVEAIDNGTGTLIIKQEFFDHINLNTHLRAIEGESISDWSNAGTTTTGRIEALEKKSIQLQKDLDKTNNNVASNKSEIDSLGEQINNLYSALATHNHDDRYASLYGGSIYGQTSIANNESFAGKNTSGNSLNLGKVNSVNDIVLGDTNAKTIIQAKTGDIELTDGRGAYRIFHSGNDGSGSGLDADTLDGVEGRNYARTDTTNYLNADQNIENGKNINLVSPSGNSQAGSLFFRDSRGTQKGKIKANTSGDLELWGGSTLGQKISSNGTLESEYDHVLNAKNRQVAVRFKKDDKDEGMGFYLNGSTNQVGLYDWASGTNIFRSDRDEKTVRFYQPIFIQGHKLSIQSSKPSGASNGDIWIDI